jgi:hypothetical protein
VTQYIESFFVGSGLGIFTSAKAQLRAAFEAEA